MNTPRLIEGSRRNVAALLVAVALGQGLAAAAGADAIRRTIETVPGPAPGPALMVAGLGLAAGLATLGERWVGERLAQSYVNDARRQLFEALIASGRSSREGRWLTPFVSDLAALRNWAARGPVRLATASLSTVAASLWFATAWPALSAALLPFALCLVAMAAAMPALRGAIASQRTVRGALTRFLIRRVRAEVAGICSPRGHGRKGLAERASELSRLAERRAAVAGVLEAAAVLAGALSALAVVVLVQLRPEQGQGALIGGLALAGFIASRFLEISRALHAHVGGRIALLRLGQLLSGPSRTNGDDE